MNNLKNSLSPYLLLHSKNPVDWFPWEDFALNKAKIENKPIFLSIGYSTCHWCYVMEKESFEDTEIARILNENFISIKVDREERPDIDQIYINFLFLFSGKAGWPLNVFLTPDLKPFYGGSYFPKENFKYLILKISEIWKEKREEIERDAEEILREIKAYQKNIGATPPEDALKLSRRAFEYYKNNFDLIYGGFFGAPKFPMAPSLKFLLDYYKTSKDEESLKMVIHTLNNISRGGITDHLSGGFHRYSVDFEWKIPHFEKMLTDQFQLLELYLSLYQITEKELYKKISKKTLNFLLKEMKGKEGGFFSAINADSLNEKGEMEEGYYYRFGRDEISKILSKEEEEIFYKYYEIYEGVIFKKKEEEISKILDILLKEREKRNKPALDDKVITSHQGMGISLLSKASLVLKDKNLLDHAEELKNFVLKNLYRKEENTLFRYYRKGKAKGRAFIQDFSFLIKGLIELYEATGNYENLIYALKLQEKQIDSFYDEVSGCFFNTMEKDIPYKTIDEYESSCPSGNSVSFLNLLKLGKIFKREDFIEISKNLYNFYSSNLKNNPSLIPSILGSFLNSGKEVEFIISCKKEDYFEILSEIEKYYIPFKTIIYIDEREDFLSEFNPFIKNFKPEEKPTLYICKNFRCLEPLKELEGIKNKLREISN
ncbi:MAG: thioredoxin domain-containing protein [Thermoanaerobaculia bacterium]